MKFLIEPTFRFHLRCAVAIVSVAAFATLLGAFFVNGEQLNQLAIAQRGLTSQASLIERRLHRTAAEIRTERDNERLVFEERLQGLVNGQGVAAAAAGNRASFAIDKVIGSIVALVCMDNSEEDVYYTGSGTVVDKSGLIITNGHLLLSGDDTLIRYCGVGFTDDLHVPPKIAFVGMAVAVHSDTDLALLKITERLEGGALPKAFPAVSLKETKKASDALNLGDPIYIGGYPGIGADTFTFTQGVVSGRVGKELIKTSALIDSGTSGGAAFDADGRYVGVPTAAARGDIGGSLGYIVGANVVEAFMLDYAAGKNTLSKTE